MELLFCIVVIIYLPVTLTSLSYIIDCRKYIYNNIPKEKKVKSNITGHLSLIITAPIFHFVNGLFLIFSKPDITLYEEMISITSEISNLTKEEKTELIEKSKPLQQKWFNQS